VVDVTDVSPARTVVVLPKDKTVLPMVIELFRRAELGILVSPDPFPTKLVADSVPVEGLNLKLGLVKMLDDPLAVLLKVT
jgi:hypothetical protein